jgi:excisionase family DNA binding protein
MGLKEKSDLLRKVSQLANQANELLIAVSEYVESTSAAVEEKQTDARNCVQEKDVLTSDEACSVLKRSKASLYGFVSRGELARYGSGRQMYFKRSDLIDFMLQKRKPTKAELNEQADAILQENRNKRRHNGQ